MCSARWSELRLSKCFQVGDHQPGNVCILSPEDVSSGLALALVKFDDGRASSFCRIQFSEKMECGSISLCSCRSRYPRWVCNQRVSVAFFSEQDFPRLSKVYLESVARKGPENDVPDCDQVLQRLNELVQVSHTTKLYKN